MPHRDDNATREGGRKNGGSCELRSELVRGRGRDGPFVPTRGTNQDRLERYAERGYDFSWNAVSIAAGGARAMNAFAMSWRPLVGGWRFELRDESWRLVTIRAVEYPHVPA
jgi:hypothetical protein